LAFHAITLRIRTRHYSYRTECTYVDWVRRFLGYAAQRQGVPHPRVTPAVIRDYLTHLAVHQRVAASTQNQAFSPARRSAADPGIPRTRKCRDDDDLHVAVYRRDDDGSFPLAITLGAKDAETLTTPLLPGWELPLVRLFRP
jgi:hypothetical protein